MSYQVILGDKASGAIIVDLSMAKANSRIEFNDEDTLLQLFVDAAAAEIENYIGGPVLIRENSKIIFDAWVTSFSPKMPISAIIKVSYINDQGTTIVIPAQDYTLSKGSNTLMLDIDEPTDFKAPLTIEANLGYATAEMPADIKRAALLIFANAETYRENAPVKLETSAKALLRPYRYYG